MGNNQSYNNQSYDNQSYNNKIDGLMIQNKSESLQIDDHSTNTNYFVKRIIKNLYYMYKDFTINSISRELYKYPNGEDYYIVANISLPNDNTNKDIYFLEILQFSDAPPSISADSHNNSFMAKEFLYKKNKILFFI